MKADKEFDCVQMKNAIQAKVLEEKRRLGEAEVIRRHRQWLETSDDPLARWWRSLPPSTFPRQVAGQSPS
jgi:hypothetical protein